ncbi:MAG: PDZ domain-containing protein [Candidatus Paceibacterota bacterium]|jgi:hypothetical protein
MQNKNKTLFQNLPKTILALSLIVGIGAILGIMMYLIEYRPYINLEPESGSGLDQSLDAGDEVAIASPEISVTKDWKIYESKKYGFSVKYPPDWKVSENTRNRIALFNLDYTDNEGNYSNISIGSMPSFDPDRNREITFEEMTEDLKRSFVEGVVGSDNIEERNIVIGNITAYNLSSTKDGKYTNGSFVLRENDVFAVLCATENIEDNPCTSVLNDMISTLRFMEKSKPAFIGVNIKEVSILTEDDRVKVGLPKELDYGVLILSDDLVNDLDWVPQSIGDGIVDGSPAESAGLQAGDVILEVNGEQVMELEGIMEKYSPGDKIVLKVLKNGEQIETEVTLAEFPESLNQ